MSMNFLPGHTAEPCAMVIFGATGDLTKRKLIPALCNLAKDNLLSRQFAIIGFAFNDLDTETFRKNLTEEIRQFATSPVESDIWEWFLKRIYYVKGDFKDPAAYQQLKQTLDHAEKEHSCHGNHFYYLAVAPKFFGEIVRQLGDAGLSREENGEWRRVIIEKP